MVFRAVSTSLINVGIRVGRSSRATVRGTVSPLDFHQSSLQGLLCFVEICPFLLNAYVGQGWLFGESLKPLKAW
jgi:hypothetical protein